MIGSFVRGMVVVSLVLPVSGAWAAGGDELWSASFTGAGPATTDGTRFLDVAVGPDGTVYSTGSGPPRGGGNAMVTVAHSPSGELLWAARILGSARASAGGSALAVDVITCRLYVTGETQSTATDLDITTVAYDLVSGAPIWVARYDGAGGDDYASEIAVDPSSGTVFVSGSSEGADGRFDYATVAYSPSGARKWTARYQAFDGASDYSTGMGLDALGNVYVTGYSTEGRGDEESTTLSYAANGRLRWTRTSPGGPPKNDLQNQDLIVDAARGTVYVTGAQKETYPRVLLTQAYSLTGQRLWAVNSPGALAVSGQTVAMALDESSGRIYVTGGVTSLTESTDFITTAFDPPGTIAWSQRLAVRGNAQRVAVDQSTHTAYVTGWSYQDGYATVTAAYSADGELQWQARKPALGAYPFGIAVDHVNGHIYVVGAADDGPTIFDHAYATIVAYRGR